MNLSGAVYVALKCQHDYIYDPAIKCHNATNNKFLPTESQRDLRHL